jgi:hypothetical protein
LNLQVTLTTVVTGLVHGALSTLSTLSAQRLQRAQSKTGKALHYRNPYWDICPGRELTTVKRIGDMGSRLQSTNEVTGSERDPSAANTRMVGDHIGVFVGGFVVGVPHVAREVVL